jgi:hypothetical protein
MESFKTHAGALANLETFAPDVFVGDDDVSQETCNFVLSLALIWNDCKDAVYAHTLLTECHPKSDPGPTREWGAYGGIDLHLFRYEVSLVHELLTLVLRNQSIARGYYVDRLVRKLPDEVRDAWYSLLQVALGSVPNDPFGRCLLAIRNKLDNHYDPRVLEKGYRNHFLTEDREDDRAFISRGGDMRSTRFYFADAAAFGYLQEVPGGNDWDQLREDVRSVTRYLGDALMGIVTGFVSRRTGGAGFEDEGGAPARDELVSVRDTDEDGTPSAP